MRFAAITAQLRRPAALAGALFFALGAGIVANALFLQPRPHPAPLVHTRADSEPASANVPEIAAAEPDERVAVVQDALARSAYGPLTADGVFGPQTRDAILRFQRDHGLPLTGAISDALVVELRAAGAIDTE